MVGLVPEYFVTHISTTASRFVNQDHSIHDGPDLQIKFLTMPSFNLLEIEIVPNEAMGVPVEN